MIVKRDIFINPVEPEYIAFKFSSGIDTRLDLAFKNQEGYPWPEDVVAQLQMVGRTDGRTAYYPCPATDLVNGTARALIPAGLAYDANGWALRLTATISQEPRVIAYGVATAVAGAGEQAVAQDVIDTIDLTLTRTVDVTFTVKIWKDVDKTVPYDLSATTVAATVYDRQGGSVLAPFTVASIDVNIITLTMPAATVDGLPDQCWWTLVVTTSSGLTTLAAGNVTVITPP